MLNLKNNNKNYNFKMYNKKFEWKTKMKIL
jgi:hypothetical protein